VRWSACAIPYSQRRRHNENKAVSVETNATSELKAVERRVKDEGKILEINDDAMPARAP
jgi:hypothetical protein